MPYILAAFAALFALIVAAWRSAVRRILAFERLEVLLAPAPGRRVAVDGVSLHCIERGRGDPLVLIHGLGASTFSWRENIDELSRDFRVIAVDLLGFGYSQRLADADYSLTAHARRVAALMDALGIESASVAGHSLGGAVAMHLAEDYPQRVRGLILVDAATPRETKAFARTRFFAATNPIGYAFVYNNRRLRRWLIERLYFDKSQVTDEVVEGYVAPGRYRGNYEARARLARHMARDADPRLDALRQPALILWGAKDPLVPPRRGRWLADRIAGSRLVPIDRAGHNLPEEQPEAVNKAIRDFARRAPAPATSVAAARP